MSASFSFGREGRCRLRPPCVNRLDKWAVWGINGTEKREDVVDVLRKGKFEGAGGEDRAVFFVTSFWDVMFTC